MLTLPDGAQQTISLLAEQGHEYGLLQEHTTTSGEIYTTYGRARPVDPSFAPTDAVLIGDAASYWESTVRAADVNPNGARRGYFGFRFDGSGAVTKIIGENTIEGPLLQMEETWSFTITGGAVHIEERFDRDLTARCERTEPSCFVMKRRTWKPIARFDHLLYMLESETWIADQLQGRTGRIAWDEGAMAWIDDSGARRDPEDGRLYTVFPRVNAYTLDALPNP